ncbi:SRPBCC family protein [uncultured Kordia sp.]|uniref:SRPBCC family protein n=1 Tax=uncultured Kordia sp. TaxID=507699 RepID=UPI00262BEC80|nr:SRPBCC family protein [uncultured Kordia sp.]
MKYTCTIDINLPITKVVALWNDEAYFKEWQDGFERIELISGTPDTKGAKSKIFFNGKHKMELLETIISNDLPNEKVGLYEHIHMTNTQTSRFIAIDEHKTQYISEVEYTKFNGFMIKLMAKLFPGKFKQQSQKWMNQFKDFAENYTLK